MPVHVVGNACLDTTFRLARFPGPGETLNAIDCSVALGGKGANQALAAWRAGADVMLWSAVGSDGEAALVRRGLMEAGLSDHGLTALPLPTDRSAIMVDETGENQIVSAVACARAFDPAASGWLAAARPGDALVLQGNLTPAATRAALEAGRALGLLTVLNASPLDERADGLPGAPAVTVVNRVEGEALTGEREPGLIAERLARMGGGAAVVTLGADGYVAVQDPAAAPRFHPAAPAEALDTSGAGDVFCGTLAARLSLGDAFEPALHLAARAAAVAVTRTGTFGCGPSRDEFHAWHTRDSA
ncbi:PfkB family carbohydrate kinase [Aureimonas phyllosphaerae]|uniref:PfkB family carbohydrate kinase n=1 Tax=Aureimonas phyllosphaerae TaxID=1166078 RepID=UPI003A5C2805